MTIRVFAVWAACSAAVAVFAAELPRDVKYVAHQGEEALAPNHSLPAYKFAVEHKLDYMKLDVRETKDGVVVIQHDETIKAMTGADLAIKDTPYAELKKYVYRPRGGFANETIVTLPEALVIAKALPGIWIDFKYFTPAFAEKVLRITAEAGIGTEEASTWVAAAGGAPLHARQLAEPTGATAHRAVLETLGGIPDIAIVDAAARLQQFDADAWIPVVRAWVTDLARVIGGAAPRFLPGERARLEAIATRTRLDRVLRLEADLAATVVASEQSLNQRLLAEGVLLRCREAFDPWR